MGIPGLATSLEPYAARFTSTELGGHSAILDGPAFAYHAHKLASDTNSTRPPTYAEVHAIAIRWLNALETLNIKVSAILFDGALPSSKKNERFARLQQMIKRMVQLRHSCPATACPVPTSLGSIAFAFLAPSLMEALQLTKYAACTRIVPGEADDWCAYYAKKSPRSVIFTGDTDLLLFDYPPETVLIFFKDVLGLAISDLKAYSPSQLCQRLELKSLATLAYAITVDRWKTMNENIQVARTCDLSSDSYIDFSRRYQHIVAPSPTVEKTGITSALQCLDVRFSEFVHQALAPPELAPDVYLPLLFEDPNEASAWKLGLDVRLLAYSLVMPQPKKVVREYTRRAQDAAVQVHSLPVPDAARLVGANLLDTLAAWSVPELTARQRWYLVSFRISTESIKPPHSFLVERVIQDDFDNTWSYVHLNARLQATLYSLRMLKQSIEIWSGIDHEHTDPTMCETIEALRGSLSTLPSIADLFGVPGQSSSPPETNADLHPIIKQVYQSAGIDREDLFEEPKSKRQRKREKERRRKEERAQEGRREHSSSNIFSLLQQRSNA
ncbi:hypothetical protein BU24DRAFT_196648 [Aaosphaeria arxii CBS 175.79]|uniref:Asteroid domain-containing protein n=1 Tax=Aaosphaeria arxii CBS 175.79 TaxID=1450172 RepID=A0A6A5XSN8_9PLEO|nr:uncharacterized protein BU24DRAFT_196648 [Aaosphaeria arxii CBS 175.79]KAF2016202.1 hypothetical protein BU24DRAFT_196648 [Aaosphaeria arxii CBS 175.79]